MEIQLFSLAEHTPEGFKSINTYGGVLPSTTIILHADSVEKALTFLRAYPASPRGVIVTVGDSFDSSPASSDFWHLVIPENNFPAVRRIAECYINTFGCDSIPKPDSYEALQSRISVLLLKAVEIRDNEEMPDKNQLLPPQADRTIPGVIFQFYIRKSGEYGFDYIRGNPPGTLGIPEDSDKILEDFVKGIPPEYRDAFYSSLDNAASSKSDWIFETPFVRSSGEMIWLRGISKPTVTDDVILFRGIISDMTEQRKTSKRMEDINSLLHSIRNVNHLIVHETVLEDLLQKVCETLIESEYYRDCTIMLLDDEGNTGDVFQAGIKNYLKDEMVSVSYTVCAARVIDSGNYFLLHDPGQCRGCKHLAKRGDNFYPMFVAPMKSEDRTAGILFLALSSETVIDTEGAVLLQEMADELAFAMEKLHTAVKPVKSEEKYRKLFDSSPDAMMTMEPPSWKFTSGNPSVLKMFGVS
ncbi:MAG: GAF domain-containing protein, partial [Candidatus Fermentibacteria bacterium]